MTDLREDLRRVIQDGEAVLVVGAGVSIGATNGAKVASWMGLLEDGIDHCVAVCNQNDRWRRRQLEALEDGDLQEKLNVASDIEGRLRRAGEFGTWLDETIGKLKAEDERVLRALHALNLPILTTNYDELIEDSTDRETVTWKEEAAALEVLRGKKCNTVLHLHGKYSDPDSIVLGNSSYGEVGRHVPTQVIQQAFTLMKSLIFVGCGGTTQDPNLGRLLKWMSEHFGNTRHRHYRLSVKGEMEATWAEHDKQRVVPIEFGEEYGSLGEFLEDLAPDPKPETEEGTPAPGSPGFAADPLPPPPPRREGRDAELAELVEALLQDNPKPIPILGGPGVGKSHLTLSALHHPDVKARFGSRRFFVRCDGAPTAEALLGEIARTLGIEGGEVLPAVLAILSRRPAVLALDNAETPWEPEQLKTEGLLARLAVIEHLALIASIRGFQKPLELDWQDEISVKPLRREEGKRLFLRIAGRGFEDDPFLIDLLKTTSELPLAIELLAHQAQGRSELRSLKEEWNDKRSELLRRSGVETRLTNIQVSFELSLSSNRMTPEAKQLLAYLGQLPGGISSKDLYHLMPGGDLPAQACLEQLGLAFVEPGEPFSRLRMLSPLREVAMSRCELSATAQQNLVNRFLSIVNEETRKISRSEGREALARLIPEVGNIEHCFRLGLDSAKPKEVATQSIYWPRFMRFSALGNVELVWQILATLTAPEDSHTRASLLLQMGHLAMDRSDHQSALQCYREAQPLFKIEKDLEGEGHCLQKMGDIQLLRNKPGMAHQYYEQAMLLFKEAGSELGQATCLHGMGDILLDSSAPSEARQNYLAAMPLYKAAESLLGQANCLRSLGDILFKELSYEGASNYYQQAMSLFERSGSLLGRANCLRSLGNVLAINEKSREAQHKFRKALDLYENIQDLYSVASTNSDLARLADTTTERRQHLHAARNIWRQLDLPHEIDALVKEFGEADVLDTPTDSTTPTSYPPATSNPSTPSSGTSS